ncbi:isochorismatase domain-containing protein 1-like [Calliphora vicina]|uniref:isochorismatase domain-containing protein 1-like n=1 Tax=Calliphora vicina TaxID=7373 RepID=UPI00325BE9B5
MARKLAHLYPKNTLFMLCDVQEKFRPAMPLFNNLIGNAKRLTAAGKILNVPLLVTEQNPEKLGKTVEDLDICHAKCVVSKTRFSMMVPEIECYMKNLFDGGKPSDVILYGMESHICIEQTAIDLLAQNINVFVVADCVASRVHQDRNMALKRLQSTGCFITTTESVIYQLLRDKNHPRFNDLKKLLVAKSLDMEIKS